MHGGTITVDSPGLNQGSTFTVRLPIAQQAPAVAQPPANGVSIASANPQRVLIVDDNRDTAVACAQLFTKLGHNVQTANDGMTALETARTFRPQAIFLDIGLPGMNGYEVAKQLRQEGFTEELIVAVSGYGQPEDRHRSRQAGFDDHLVKPVHQNALSSLLQRHAEKHAVVA
jgi:CheY-like chemotaxis protein